MTIKISKWLFLILIVSLPLVRPFNFTVSGLQVPFTDLIFIPVFAFWIAALLRREANLRFDNFFFFLAFYGLALTISSFFSIAPRKSFFKLAGEFYLFALAVLGFQFTQEKNFLKQISIAWLVGTLLTILATAAGFIFYYLGFKTQADNYFLSHFGSLPAGNYPRIHALFANANMMCNFLNLSLIFVLLAEKAGWIKKLFARILHLGVWFAAFFTFSAGIGGMILSFGIWYWVLLKTEGKLFLSKIVLFSSILCAIGIFCSTLFSPDTLNTTQDFKLPFTEKRLEVSVRVLVWENAIENFTNNPFIGKGTGTDAVLVKYQTLSGDKQTLLDAHNNWLNILVQIGIFGFLAFLLLMFNLLSKTRFSFKEISEDSLIQIAFSCAFVGAFLYQGLSGSFEDARHLWVLFGLLIAAAKLKTDTLEASKEP